MKDAYYFSHDSNARHDPKLISFCSKYGAKGYAFFFMLIEFLREQDNYRLSTLMKPSISLLWRCYGDVITQDEFDKTFEDMKQMGLFVEQDGWIFSPSLNERMVIMEDARAKFSRAGKAGATSRWRCHNTPMALKESKVKERKEKEVIQTSRVSNDQFIETLKNSLAYKHINLDIELAKMDVWFTTPKGRGRKKTPKFILNWLNRIEAPIEVKKKEGNDLVYIADRLRDQNNLKVA